jgi:hypothetical protein
MPRTKLSKNDIKTLLGNHSNLKYCIQQFHSRLAEKNAKREVHKNRTPLEVSTDALGRLLTGDETCAAVAIDNNKVYVATNKTGHCKKTLNVNLKRLTALASSTKEKVQLRLELDFCINHRTINHTFDVSYTPIQDIPCNYEEFSQLPAKLNPEVSDFNFTFPFEGGENAHGINEYPYPININLTLDAIPEIPESLTQDISRELNKLMMSFSLDPLKRRAEAVFHHLGLIAVYKMKSHLVPQEKFVKTIEENRLRVIKQTLGWEAPVWISGKGQGYAVALRQFNIPETCKTEAEKNAWAKKKEHLKEFFEFVEQITRDLNTFISSNKQVLRQKIAHSKAQRSSESERKTVVKQGLISSISYWTKEKITAANNGRLANLPRCFNQDTHAEHGQVDSEIVSDFFHRAKNYFIDLLSLEDFFDSIQDKDFSEILASIGFNDIVRQKLDKTREDCTFYREDAEIIIVDTLSDGAHAEMRLFKAMNLENRVDQHQHIPYFGITMLCCANCHLFLNSHGVTYIEGKPKQAGKHGKHYPGWVFDFSEFEQNISKFLGENLYLDYDWLDGYITYDNTRKTKKEWMFAIIEELGCLEEKDLKELRFVNDKIWSAGSNHSHQEDHERLMKLESQNLQLSSTESEQTTPNSKIALTEKLEDANGKTESSANNNSVPAPSKKVKHIKSSAYSSAPHSTFHNTLTKGNPPRSSSKTPKNP